MTVWDDVVGQPEAVATLTAAAGAAAAIVAGSPTRPGAMTHAWLFTGPPGSGRSVAARAFAAALECANGGDGDCAQCRTVRAGTHADVHVVVPSGLSIAVKEMREIVLTAARQPLGGRWHVLLIEDADRLTERAANALLKAIEEPPARTVFLLCAPSSHPDDIPVTVRSRCRVVPVRTPPPDAVADVLVRRDGSDPELARWAARAAQGHVGRARWLARDADARERRAAVLAIPASLTRLDRCLAAADQLVRASEEEAAARSALLDEPEREALAQSLGAGMTRGHASGPRASARPSAVPRGGAGAMKDLETRQKSRATRTQRDALDRALVDLAAFFRDVLVRQSGADVEPAHPDSAGDVARIAERLSPTQALTRLRVILACRDALEQNVKPRIAVEALTASLRLP
ncbi:MAG: DNA polymerase III subunit delta' [Mycobacteriales bacterium]